MRKLYGVLIAIFLCLITVATITNVVSADYNKQSSALRPNGVEQTKVSIPAGLDSLIVTITGLKENDVATITLLTETAKESTTPIKEYSILGNGSVQSVNLSGALKDGYYRINISAPEQYFREPKSWLFMVGNSKLANPQGKSVTFNLIPPELQTYKPFRDDKISSNIILEPPTGTNALMVEPMRSLSDSPKQPYGNVIDSTGYHHFHWESSLPKTGIWARFTVTNPGVRHGATGDMALDHIYVLKNGTYKTLEIGWVEGNWLSNDTRYGFYYDPDNGWGYFTLPGSPLEVALASNGNTWYADYVSGGSWVIAWTVNLGYSQYDKALNGGEVYTGYPTHPSLPVTTTDLAKLYIDGNWINWDWQRWATTHLINDADAYSLHTTTNYYNFYIHSD